MDIKHVGMDSLYVAFKGCLSRKALRELEQARSLAKDRGEPEYFEFNGLEGLVLSHGTSAKQGYRYILNTGEDKETWQIKSSEDPMQWNIFVEVRAIQLAVDGYFEVKKRLYDTLNMLGCITLEESINRVDVAVDIQCDDFEQPDPLKFICHSHATVKRHYDQDNETEGFRVVGNRKITSITIGQIPGRQVIIYDKRREAVYKQKAHWFEIWGQDKKDCPQIWRVEARFGKKYLSEQNIKTFDALEKHLSRLVDKCLTDIRMVDEVHQSNVSRSRTHELWDIAKNRLMQVLEGFVRQADRTRIMEVCQNEYNTMLEKQMRGLLATLAASKGLDVVECLSRLPSMMANSVKNYLQEEEGKDFKQKYRKARERLMWCEFLQPSGHGQLAFSEN